MNDRGHEVPWGYIGTLGVVVVVAIGLLVLPGLLSPQPSPSPAASPSDIGDAHEVTTDQGTFRFGYDGNAISIQRIEPSTIELGRAVLPEFAQPSFTGVPASGAGAWALACPDEVGVASIRILFGYIADASTGTYAGPAAEGSFAEDGLWMFVLDPGPIDPDSLITVMSGHRGGGVRGGEFDRIVADRENPQPSGCFVSE